MSDRSFNVVSDGRAVAATTSIVFSVNTATDVTPRLAAGGGGSACDHGNYRN